MTFEESAVPAAVPDRWSMGWDKVLGAFPEIEALASQGAVLWGAPGLDVREPDRSQGRQG
ncbi:MAG TPA: hypothetical protein VGH38_03780 [Bryobacteraceae bacterium]